MAHYLILGHNMFFAYSGRVHPTDEKSASCHLGHVEHFFKLSNIKNGRHCSLENFKKFISQLLSYIET